jgi:hypothetical protein
VPCFFIFYNAICFNTRGVRSEFDLHQRCWPRADLCWKTPAQRYLLALAPVDFAQLTLFSSPHYSAGCRP